MTRISRLHRRGHEITTSLSALPSHLLLIQKLGNLSLVLKPGSREIPNKAAAAVPHSLELETQANLVVVDNTVGTQTTVAPCLTANSDPT